MSAALAMVANSPTTVTPKRHGFSIESLIGRQDDSPKRQTSILSRAPEERPRSRQDALSPTSTDDERRARVLSPASSSPTTSPRLDKASPEIENRFPAWTSDDLKHLLGNGTFFHHHQHNRALVDEESTNLYQSYRVCNRSLSAAMNTVAGLMPPQFAGLHMNPLLYNFHRDIAHHQAAHPLLAAARYPGFVHPRYPRK